jgi:hypothetical protein
MKRPLSTVSVAARQRSSIRALSTFAALVLAGCGGAGAKSAADFDD